MITGERIHGSSNLSVLLIVDQKPVVGVCDIFKILRQMPLYRSSQQSCLVIRSVLYLGMPRHFFKPAAFVLLVRELQGKAVHRTDLQTHEQHYAPLNLFSEYGFSNAFPMCT